MHFVGDLPGQGFIGGNSAGRESCGDVQNIRRKRKNLPRILFGAGSQVKTGQGDPPAGFAGGNAPRFRIVEPIAGIAIASLFRFASTGAGEGQAQMNSG